MQLNINTDAAVKFTNKLEKISRSALPVTVRQTLDGAAFDVKKNTMPNTAKGTFTQRKANFFKANSKVEKASGFNISTMRSTVGFKPNTNKTQKAVEELEQQERGGKIKDRDFVAMDSARASGKHDKNVRAVNTLSKLALKNRIDAKTVKGTSNKQKFIRAAFKAAQTNALVVGNFKTKQGGYTVSRIDSLSSNAKSRKLEIKRTPLYNLKNGRFVEIKATNFMKRASLESGMKLERFYIKNAKFNIEKYSK